MSNSWFHKEDKTTFTEHVSKLGNPVTTHLACRTWKLHWQNWGFLYKKSKFKAGGNKWWKTEALGIKDPLLSPFCLSQSVCCIQDEFSEAFWKEDAPESHCFGNVRTGGYNLGLQWGSCVHPNCILFLYKIRKTRKNQLYLITVSFPGGSAVKNPPANAGQTQHTGWIAGSGRSPEEETAPHSSVLAWRIPRTEQPGGLQSMGNRVRHNSAQHSTAADLCLLVPHLRIQQTTDWWHGEPATRTWASADTPWGPGTNHHGYQGVSLQSYYVISPKLLTTPTSWKHFSPISL